MGSINIMYQIMRNMQLIAALLFSAGRIPQSAIANAQRDDALLLMINISENHNILWIIKFCKNALQGLSHGHDCILALIPMPGNLKHTIRNHDIISSAQCKFVTSLHNIEQYFRRLYKQQTATETHNLFRLIHCTSFNSFHSEVFLPPSHYLIRTSRKYYG
jgi:hypothetical protein